MLVIFDEVNAEGAAHAGGAGGVQENVLPEEGNTVFDKVSVDVFAVPAAVPAQVVVLDRLL